MLLIVARSKRLAMPINDILYRTGVLTHLVKPIEAFNDVSYAYRAVLVMEPQTFPDIEDFISRLREYVGMMPIFSISREGPKNPCAHLFDKSYKIAIMSANLLSDISAVCARMGMPSIGDYRFGGIDASADMKKALYFDREIDFTRTEMMILRYLMRVYPVPQDSRKIVNHSFRPGKQPMPETVKTHVSALNKKFRERTGRNLITMMNKGYVLLTPEIINIMKEKGQSVPPYNKA